jgi:hypothetical protein
VTDIFVKQEKFEDDQILWYVHTYIVEKVISFSYVNVLTGLFQRRSLYFVVTSNARSIAGANIIIVILFMYNDIVAK